jgi:type IV secretion system protein VirB11
MSTSLIAIESFLQPLYEYFNQDGVNEILINRPKEIWVEKKGEIIRYEVDILDFDYLRALADLIAENTNQIITDERPLLSATLPNGYRVQIILPPACESGSIGYAIRKPTTIQLSLDDYDKMGLFDSVKNKVTDNSVEEKLSEFLKNGNIKEFLRYAIRERRNMIIAGGTSTGKTTFTNAVLKELDSSERLITIEDAREVVLSNQPNKLHLLASKGGQGKSKVSTQDLIESCLRLRPDRIIVGEIRGAEAFSFLRAINTGHPGSISTVHADSPAMAIEQLTLMTMQAGLGLPQNEIRSYIKNIIDVIIQLSRDHETGRRYISSVYFKYLSSNT